MLPRNMKEKKRSKKRKYSGTELQDEADNYISSVMPICTFLPLSIRQWGKCPRNPNSCCRLVADVRNCKAQYICGYWFMKDILLIKHWIILLYTVGRLVWNENNLEAEVSAEGTEQWHLHTCWQEREDGAEKLTRSWLKKKKSKWGGAKIFALSPPCVWHFNCLCAFLFSSWGDWKGLGKKEKITVKTHHWNACIIRHFSLSLLQFKDKNNWH